MPNQFTKARELGLPTPSVSAETRKLISERGKQGQRKRFQDADARKRMSDAMKIAVQKYPESYGASNRGRTKRIDKHGISFQGKWELEFYEWCLSQSININRPSQGFPYVWEGNRTYFPDFYLPDLDLFVEVKGYETERDRAKWEKFPHKLSVIRRQQIEQIRRNKFTLITE